MLTDGRPNGRKIGSLYRFTPEEWRDKKCFRDALCIVNGAARGHHSCLTQFYLFVKPYFFKIICDSQDKFPVQTGRNWG